MYRLIALVGAAGALICAIGPAHAATVVTYNIYASGGGTRAYYLNGNYGPFIMEKVKSSILSFSIPIPTEFPGAYGRIDAGEFDFLASINGFNFRYDTYPNEFIPGAVSGNGNACFSNLSGGLPTGEIKLLSGPGCNTVSYLKQGKYFYEDFSGTIDSIRVKVSEGENFATASIIGYVPEPTSWATMLVGFGMMGAAMRYRRRGTKVAYA